MRRRDFIISIGGAAGRVATRGAGAAAGDASDRISQQWIARRFRALRGRVPAVFAATKGPSSL
jgi:hypothetical protein